MKHKLFRFSIAFITFFIGILTFSTFSICDYLSPDKNASQENRNQPDTQKTINPTVEGVIFEKAIVNFSPKSDQLPKTINSSLNKMFPSWRFSRVDSEVKHFFKERFPGEYPNYIKGDFDGNGKFDYALLIEHSNFDNSGKAFTHVVEMLAFLEKESDFELYILAEPAPANSILYLNLAKKGEEGSDFHAESKFIYPNDSIRMSYFEKAGGTYIFEKEKFRYVTESD